MPDQPSWIEQLPAILRQLERPECPDLLDRPAIERLFGLSARQANRILRKCAGGYTVGRSVLVPRQSLLALLSGRQEACQREQDRRQRLSAQLADARNEARRRKIVIPHRAATSGWTLNQLPAGVALEPGLLRVEFASALDLMEKLFALAQTLASDLDGLEQLAPGPGCASVEASVEPHKPV